MMRLSVSISLPAALLSAFFNRLRRNLADLTGHRPAQMPHTHVQHLARFPAEDTVPTLSGLKSLRLGSAANTAVESPEGHALLVLLDIGKVGVGLRQLHTGENSCGFTV